MTNDTFYSRRKFLSKSAILLPTLGLLGSSALAQQSDLTPTPRQTEGPFYPRSKPDDIDNDLAALGDSNVLAAGSLLSFKGKVLDQRGNHVSGARVEIWHCDQYGKYHHVGLSGQIDENFQGYGETQTDGEGCYSFRTIKPGIYPGRACHIHFKVIAEGHQNLTSQLYFSEEMAGNMRDGIYSRLNDKERKAVTMDTQLISAGGTVRSGQFDIVLR